MTNSKTKLLAKIVAPIIAILSLFVFMLLPMYIFRILSGIPLDAEGPENEVWFLVIGGGIGAGVAYISFHFVLAKFGGYNQKEIGLMWNGKNKNT